MVVLSIPGFLVASHHSKWNFGSGGACYCHKSIVFFPREVFVFLEMEDWGLAATTTIIWFGLFEHEAQHAVFE